jgi:uncharacterized protein (DUF983 family)
MELTKIRQLCERLLAVLGQKCPTCFQGAVFRGSISMHERCSQCGTRFEREQGYFMGAMYFAHALAMGILAGLTLLGWRLGVGSLKLCFLLATIVLLLSVPAIFRYSRVMWMHLDQILDPRPDTGHALDRSSSP